MADPTDAFRRNPPKDPYAEARDKFRRNPPTMLGSSATAGGPGVEAGIEQGERTQATRPPPTAGTVAEIGLSTAMGIFPGEAFAARLASGMTSRFGMLGAEIMGRGLLASAGGILGSELTAPGGETPEEAQRRQNVAGITSFASEAMTPALKIPLSAAITPIRARLGGLGAKEMLELGAPEAQALLASMGKHLTPGQMRTGKLLDTFENMVSASFGGGQIMEAHKIRTQQAAIDTIEKVIPAFTKNLSTEDAGYLMQGVLDGTVRLDRAATSGAYRTFESNLLQAGAKNTEIVPVTNVLNEALKRLGDDPKDAASLEVLSLLRQSGGNPISFERAENIRGDLLAMARRGQGTLPSKKALASDLAQLMDESITATGLSLGGFGPEVVGSLNRARGLSRTSHERYEHEAIASLIDKVKPEAAARMFLADENPTQIRMLKDVLFDKKYRVGRIDADGNVVPPIKNPTEIWNKVRSAWIFDKTTESGAGKYSVLSGSQLVSALRNTKGSAKELFTPEEFANLEVSARALELIQKGAGKGSSGAIFMQMAQAGAAGNLLIGFGGDDSDKADLASGFIVLAPIPAALLLSGKGFSNYMMRSAQISERKVGQMSASLAAQAIGHLTAAKLPFIWQGNNGEVIPYDPSKGGVAPTAMKPKSKFSPSGSLER